MYTRSPALTLSLRRPPGGSKAGRRSLPHPGRGACGDHRAPRTSERQGNEVNRRSIVRRRTQNYKNPLTGSVHASRGLPTSLAHMRGRGRALTGTGQSATRPLLPTAGRPLAVAIVVACVLVTAVQGVWIKHGMENGWVDTAVDAKVLASLQGHSVLLAALVWPGEPVPVAAMAVALVLACILRRRYCGAALVAISVILASGLTEFVLKPLIGRTTWGNPFPSGHVTSAVALAAALTVLLAGTPASVRGLVRLVLAITAFLIAAAVAVGVIGANMHHFSTLLGGPPSALGRSLRQRSSLICSACASILGPNAGRDCSQVHVRASIGGGGRPGGRSLALLPHCGRRWPSHGSTHRRQTASPLQSAIAPELTRGIRQPASPALTGQATIPRLNANLGIIGMHDDAGT